MDVILLANNDLGLLRDIKNYLAKNFKMIDMGEASYAIGIVVIRDRSRGLLGLSQNGYINRILEIYNLKYKLC